MHFPTAAGAPCCGFAYANLSAEKELGSPLRITPHTTRRLFRSVSSLLLTNYGRIISHSPSAVNDLKAVFQKKFAIANLILKKTRKSSGKRLLTPEKAPIARQLLPSRLRRATSLPEGGKGGIAPLASKNKMSRARFPCASHIISASKTTLLRCGTQFVPAGHLLLLKWHPSSWAKPLLKINKV